MQLKIRSLRLLIWSAQALLTVFTISLDAKKSERCWQHLYLTMFPIGWTAELFMKKQLYFQTFFLLVLKVNHRNCGHTSFVPFIFILIYAPLEGQNCRYGQIYSWIPRSKIGCWNTSEVNRTKNQHISNIVYSLKIRFYLQMASKVKLKSIHLQ